MITHSLVDRFRRLVEYEAWCSVRVVASLRSVPEPHRTQPQYARALQLAGHNVAAQQVWLLRLGRNDDAPTALFPQSLSLEELEQNTREMLEAWCDYLMQVGPTHLEMFVEYHTTAGALCRNTVEEILLHVFAHGIYHRGQIALLVRQLGGTPAVTDFIVWARENNTAAAFDL